MSHEPFLGSEAVARGRLSWNQLRGPRYRRLFPNVYLPSDVTVDLAVRSRAAYLLVRDRGGLLAGYSAALLTGADVAPLGVSAEVLVTHRCRVHPGLRVHSGAAVGDDVVEAVGCVVTSPARTAWDLCRRLPRIEAVVALDALCRAGTFPPAALLERRVAQPGARGCRQLDDVVALSDPRAESPPESRLRLDLHFAGLPPPEVQYVVYDEHGFVLAVADLAYPEAKLAIEYDGAVHFTRRQRERDLQRDAILAGHGWLTLRFGRDDVGTAQTSRRVRSIRAQRARAA